MDHRYPSLFKRSSTSPRKSNGGAAAGATGLRQLPALGGAAEVIANARQHLDRARLHLNLPPLAPVELAPARVAQAQAQERSIAAAAPAAEDAGQVERRRELQAQLDTQIRELAAAAGADLASYQPQPAGRYGKDETAAYMAQMLSFLQSGALRPKPANDSAPAVDPAQQAELAEAKAALQAEQQKRAAAEQELTASASAHAAAMDSAAKELEEETARKTAVEAELAEARTALAAGSDAGAMLAAEQAESQEAKETAAKHAARITELEAALEAEQAKVLAAEASASAASAAVAAAENQHADDVLINWLSMPEGKDLLVEMVGHGAQAALVQHECDSDDCQALLMDAARQTASDDDSIPGTNMLLSVVQSVCDVALNIQQSKAAPGISVATEQLESLRSELAEASQRESDLRERQEEDGAELQRLRAQVAAAEEKVKVLAEEAAAAQAKVGELESAVVAEPADMQPKVPVPAEEEYLETILNVQARAWWKTYIGQRSATYNAVQDATTAWMLKVDSAMTQAEASIVAATVCFGIDRDGDGEITFAEFGKFSEELGDEYTVEKLRGYEVPRKEGQGVDEEKLAEYAEYLGINPVMEQDILWIARRCMDAPLPKGWKEFTDDQGQSYFHNESKQETSWDHPLDSHVRTFSHYSSTHAIVADRLD